MLDIAQTRLIAILLISGVFAAATAADEKNIPEPFRGETKGSPIEIRYDDWNAILDMTVIDAGMSDRSVASAPRPEIGTRSVRGNTSSTRNEGNRIAFPAFADYEENLHILEQIKAELEAIPDQAPLRLWAKNEQLAYWLNLYNISIIIELAKEYPMKSLRDLHEGSRKKPSLWDKKLMKVADIDLSLNDVHYILVEKWDSTIVMYGLFQGYVGGPSIQDEAYTGRNVHKLLIENAKEFVNSNRGMRPKGSTLQISEYYKENKKLFPNWEEDLKKHFISLTEFSWHDRIRKAKRIKATTDDYYIADLYAGSKGKGSASATNPAALTTAMVSSNDGAGQILPGVNFGIGDWNLDTYASYQLAPIESRFPEYVTEYIQKMRKNKSLRPGNVDVEEIEDETRRQDGSN
ncbi:DUF547 domain-containing protein [Kordiimonas sp.]|uniref:DUF547 domain-containing protein n=1 Tax=Kordiimonas sp. TaxID=1970157 RepID=UPI003A94630D